MGIDAQMFVRTRATVTDADLRRAEHELFCHFGAQLHTYDGRLLQVVDKWEQDGPTIKPAKGESFIEVHLSTRYYGEGYERGDFRLIHDIAEVLEAIFPSGEVWYGGDSSGCVAKQFGPRQRRALREHWVANARKPYSRHRNPFMNAAETADGPRCRRCNVPTHRYGWGATYAAYSCECGEKVERRGDTVTVTSRAERQRRHYELRSQALEALQKAKPELAVEFRESLYEDA